MHRVASTALAIACLAVTPTSAEQLPDSIEQLLDDCTKTLDEGCLFDLMETDVLSNYIFTRLAEEVEPDRISISAIRRDLQLGSFGSTAASTAVVAAPGVSDILSAAIESGTVIRKSDGDALTLSFNALPVGQLMLGRVPLGCGTADETCRQGVGRWTRGLSGSVSLASMGLTPAAVGSQAAETPEPTIGFLRSTRRLQSVALRYELFVRERNHQRQQEALDAAAEALRSFGAEFLSGEEKFQTRMEEVLDDSGWMAETKGILVEYKDSRHALRQVLLERYQVAYRIVMASDKLRALTARTTELRLQIIREQNRLLAEKLYRKAFTIDYLHERPTDQPRFHRLRFVLSTPLSRKPDEKELAASPEAASPSVNFTFNGGASFYGESREGTYPGRLRDAQVSAAVDWSPGARGSFLPKYTGAYYFQYMFRNGEIEFNREAVTPGPSSILLTSPATEILNTKGAIHVAQFRVSIPVGSSGVSFPAAVSYASRSELITGRMFWQGHVGVSYDFSSLKSLVR